MSSPQLQATSGLDIVSLPEIDVRTWRDEAVRRRWAQGLRDLARSTVLIGIDVIAAAIAVDATLYTLGASVGWFPPHAGPAWPFVPAVQLVQPLALYAAGAYGPGRKRIRVDRIVVGVLLAALIAAVHALLIEGPTASGLVLVAIYAAWAGMFVYIARRALDAAVYFGRRHGIGQQRLLLVSTAEQMLRYADRLTHRSGSDVRIVGRLSMSPTPEPDTVGSVSELESALRRTRTTGILLAGDLSFEALETLVRQCFECGVGVFIAREALHQLDAQIEIRHSRAGALLQLRPKGLQVPQLAIKRAIDLGMSVALLAVLWPLLLSIMLVIKLNSRGPVFFKQTRAGVGGRPFEMYKFRTMVANADEIKHEFAHLNASGDPRLFKVKDDPRVTRMGRLLRLSSLDELPQLFNVLRGEMSIIGPRPFFPYDLATYAEHHFERLSVLPGITGLWQVYGRSSIEDFEEVVRLDREYIRNWSVWLDLKILFLTLPVVLRRSGAY